jgi:hypothetical protein
MADAGCRPNAEAILVRAAIEDEHYKHRAGSVSRGGIACSSPSASRPPRRRSSAREQSDPARSAHRMRRERWPLECIGLLTTRLRGSSGEITRLPNLFLMQRPVVLAENVVAERTSGASEGAYQTSASVWKHDGDTLHVRLRERGDGGAVVEVSWTAGRGAEHDLHVRDHVLRAICTGLHQAGLSVGRPKWEKHPGTLGRWLH